MDLHPLSEELHRFVTAKGWYEANSARPPTPRNSATSLALEAAEVLKHFQWGEVPADRAELASEPADVTLYWLQLASICQIDLEQAALAKLKLNYTHTWDQ
jgi:8-oxo-dGTP diphosphatase